MAIWFPRRLNAMGWVLAVILAAGAAPAHARPTAPPGFLVEAATAQRLVNHPLAAGFDDRGRLFVAEASGRIVVLEDANGDGRFDRPSVFAEGLPSPHALVCYDGDVFVASAEGLLRLRDTDGDGASDRRTPLPAEKESAASPGVGGPCYSLAVGPDGLLYTCVAAPRGGNDAAARLVRCRLDGTHAEVIAALPDRCAGLAWSAAGDRVASTIGGALIHVIDGCDSLPAADLPPVVRTGGAAPAGLVRYRGMPMGRPYVGTVLCAETDARRVGRYVAEPNGASFRARPEPFVFSDDEDFQPVGVLEDADGTVLVIDRGAAGEAGGAPGGILRVRRDGAVRIADPRGLRLNWNTPTTDELLRRLDDLRPVVGDRAARDLARRGAEVIPALLDAIGRRAHPDQRLRLARALARADAPSAREPLRVALHDPSAPVRQTAAYACGLRRDADAIVGLIGLLRDESPAVRREAATALGRIGNKGVAAAPAPAQPGQPAQPTPGGALPPVAAVPGTASPVVAATTASQPATFTPAPAPTAGPVATAPTTGPSTTAPSTQPPPPPPAPPLPPSPAVPALLDAVRSTADPFLQHAVVCALVRINDRASTSQGLQDPDAAVQAVAKRALAAMTN